MQRGACKAAGRRGAGSGAAAPAGPGLLPAAAARDELRGGPRCRRACSTGLTDTLARCARQWWRQPAAQRLRQELACGAFVEAFLEALPWASLWMQGTRVCRRAPGARVGLRLAARLHRPGETAPVVGRAAGGAPARYPLRAWEAAGVARGLRSQSLTRRRVVPRVLMWRRVMARDAAGVPRARGGGLRAAAGCADSGGLRMRCWRHRPAARAGVLLRAVIKGRAGADPSLVTEEREREREGEREGERERERGRSAGQDGVERGRARGGGGGGGGGGGSVRAGSQGGYPSGRGGSLLLG